MRKNKIFSSLRWRFVVIYLIIAILILSLTTFYIFSMVENYIVNERINQEFLEVNNVSVRVAAFVESSDANSMYSVLSDAGNEFGGRWLIVSNSGIVQADSFSMANATRLNVKEINSILIENKSTDYGFYNVLNSNQSNNWCVYYSSSIRSGSEILGVLLYSSSIQDIVDTLDSMRINLIWFFAISIACTVIASLILSNIIIKPIKNLSNTASKISSGDFSQRVVVKGGGEISEFGNTFNMMCDKLQNIDIQRNEFVSNASHELKTPLASMKILVESLLYQDNIEPNYYKEFLSDINNELDRLNDLVNDLLLLSRMDDSKSNMNIEKNSIKSILEDCINSINALKDSKNISLTVSGLNDIIIECDRIKITQAVLNLISNAIKYSPEDSTVNIELSEKYRNAYISIIDHGVGISKDEISRVFDRFYRINKDRSRETGGSGLGLYIVQRIALLHNGRVTVESEEGKGSVFTLIIPLEYIENIGE